MDVVNILVLFIILMFQEAKAYTKHQIRAEREIVAKDGQFPFQALIRLKYGDRYPVCNGIILNSEFILTAAGCIKHYLASVNDLEVVAGGLSTNMTPSSNHVQESFVKNIIVHPTWYTTDGNFADIALLMVHPKFKETSFVKWAEIGNMMKLPSRVIISGWGNADQLAFFEGQVYNEDTCNHLLMDDISSTTFCIGSVTSKKLLLMKKYAGASVGIGNCIYGIISSSENSVATTLSQYKSWIESVIYRRYFDDETTGYSSETDYDSEESDEIIQTTHDHSSTYSTRPLRPSTATQYTTPKYLSTGRTTPFKPSTSIPTTPFHEETSEESSETDEMDESDEKSTWYTTPLVYSTTSRTVPSFKPSTSISTTPFEEQTSKESSEMDETDEDDEADSSTENDESFKPSTSIPTTLFDEETSDESNDTDETEESNESNRSTLYTLPHYSSTYKTTPFKPSTILSTTTFVEKTSAESTRTNGSEESDEVEGSTQSTTPINPYTNTKFLRSTTPFNEDEETDETEGHSTEGSTQNTTTKHHGIDRTSPHGPLSTFYEPTKNNEITDDADEVYDVKKTDEIPTMGFNFTTAVDEYHTNSTSNDSHSEPISSSVSVKFIPSYFLSILLCYLSFLTKNLI